MSVVNEAKQVASGAEGAVNKVHVPMTQRLGLFQLLKETFKQMGEDHLGAFAGNLTYSGLFSLFPFLLFIVSLLGIFHATSLVNSLLAQAGTAMPAEAVTVIRDITKSVTTSHATGAFTIGAVISILGALWGVSGGFRAVMEAMNVMYNLKESRPFWKVYAISIVLSLVVSVLLIGAVVLVVGGPAIGGAVADKIGAGGAFKIAWTIIQWPVLLGVVLLAFALVYYFAPDAKQKFKFVSPGAIGAVVLWIVFSLLFSLYVGHFGSYNKTYGAMAGLAIFLLYMYYSAYLLLIGAEVNQIIESHAADGKDPGERDPDGSLDDRTVRILKENRPRVESPA